MSSIPGEWEYSYTEHREEEQSARRQGEMKGKKEFFKVEIRLIDYPGRYLSVCVSVHACICVCIICARRFPYGLFFIPISVHVATKPSW